MKRDLLHIFCLASVMMLLTACGLADGSATAHSLPSVTTSPVASITAGSAVAGGMVTDDGNTAVSARGVCWSTGDEPSVDDACTFDGSGVGQFDTTLNGLASDTRYYVRAYAVNGQGINYGDQLHFTTEASPSQSLSLANVRTNAVTSISVDSAIVEAAILDDGHSSVTARGVCWSTSQSPGTGDFCTIDGDALGEFSSSITGLQKDTRYFVRAFATNEVGTAYGEQLDFTTNEVPDDRLPPAVVTSPISSISTNSAQGGGEVTDEGTASVTARGVCWSTGVDPDTNDECTSDGGGAGVFTSSLTSLQEDTLYNVRAYAINEVGTSYGEQLSFTTTAEQPLGCGTVTDIDGHTYDAVQIGGQCWMAENLRTTSYRDGTSVQNVTGDTAWREQTAGAWAYFDNDASYDQRYGKMYNGYAAIDNRGICPTGWSVPTDHQWKQLESELGMSSADIDGTGHRGGGANEGGRLKATGTEHWFAPNEGATNGTGFAAYPGGDRNPGPTDAGFWSIGRSSYFWTSTEAGDAVWIRALSYAQRTVLRGAHLKNWGFSIRCVED